MTDDLAAFTAFINARLDEDEAAAKAATPGPWNASMEDILSCSDDPHWAGACAANASGDDATHIARHNPVRVLREVAAKRAIVNNTWGGPDHHDMWADHVKLLAAVWSDHPDYRAEWKP